MKHYIYLDVYFCFNFLMDFFVLFITRIIIRNNKSIARISLSSGIGALYATMLLILEFRSVFITFMTYLLIAGLLIVSAFGRAKLKDSIKRLCVLYCVTFATNGLINSVYYGSRWGRSVLEKANTVTFGNLSLGMVLCVLIVATTIAVTTVDKVRKSIKTSRNILHVKLCEGATTICVKALCDTGNSLVEPMTKKPVSVIEQESLKMLKKENLRTVFIPYNSVGKQHGLMQGFVAGTMEINGEIINNPIIGIYEGKLSQNRKYEMILHPDIMEEKKEL